MRGALVSTVSRSQAPLQLFPDESDPFRYGRRHVNVQRADGTEDIKQVPLTLEEAQDEVAKAQGKAAKAQGEVAKARAQAAQAQADATAAAQARASAEARIRELEAMLKRSAPDS